MKAFAASFACAIGSPAMLPLASITIRTSSGFCARCELGAEHLRRLTAERHREVARRQFSGRSTPASARRSRSLARSDSRRRRRLRCCAGATGLLPMRATIAGSTVAAQMSPRARCRSFIRCLVLSAAIGPHTHRAECGHRDCDRIKFPHQHPLTALRRLGESTHSGRARHRARGGTARSAFTDGSIDINMRRVERRSEPAGTRGTRTGDW